jgi:tol-pal system protein YbgF
MVVFSSSREPRYRFQAALAACFLLVTVSLPALAYADDAQVRLRQLEGSVDTLNRAVFKGQMPAVAPSASGSSDYQASVETRLSELEKQIRDLTGKVEQQEFENNQMKAKLDKALADIDLRFQDMSTNAAAAVPAKQTGTLAPNDMGGQVTAPMTNLQTAPAVQPAPVANVGMMKDTNAPAAANSPTVQNLGTMSEAPGGASIPPTVGNDPAGEYENAFSQLKSGNASAAKTGFEAFIKKYPDHPLISNATYWLGESYYSQGQYDKAARIFAESYKKYPKGPKVADSLLKMGMSLGQAGKTKEACVTLAQLKKEFPAGQGVVLRRADQELGRLGCSN